MGPRDWFVVGLRLIGVWQLTSCATELVYFTDVMQGFTTLNHSLSSAHAYLLHAGVAAAAGLVLVFAAPALSEMLEWGHEPPAGSDDSKV